jgi:UDPglucose--hexose-1-phosphate uridylyltransferase
MSELRRDELTGFEVIVAAARGTRPHTVATETAPGDEGSATCPFCPGYESSTPPETQRTGTGEPDQPGWRVRVVPNKFPIVGGSDAGPGATGAHEVVVLSPDHHRSFGELEDAAAIEVMSVLRDRVRSHVDGGHVYATAVVNHGRAAGASIAHPHAQVIALDLVPRAVGELVGRVAAFGTDPLVDEPTRRPDLVVIEGAVMVWCPWASTTPFALRIAWQPAGARFEELPDAGVGAVALALRDALALVRSSLHDPAYNVVVHNAPRGAVPRFRWWIDVIPRLTTPAGFEQATGILVNTTPPEDAAAMLRGAERGT